MGLFKKTKKVDEGLEDITKRLISGESPQKLVNEVVEQEVANMEAGFWIADTEGRAFSFEEYLEEYNDRATTAYHHSLANKKTRGMGVIETTSTRLRGYYGEKSFSRGLLMNIWWPLKGLAMIVGTDKYRGMRAVSLVASYTAAFFVPDLMPPEVTEYIRATPYLTTATMMMAGGATDALGAAIAGPTIKVSKEEIEGSQTQKLYLAFHNRVQKRLRTEYEQMKLLQSSSQEDDLMNEFDELGLNPEDQAE